MGLLPWRKKKVDEEAARIRRDAREFVVQDVARVHPSGAVRLKDNSWVLLLAVGTRNYRLLSPAEQDAVLSSYWGFLNGLDGSVQVVTITDLVRLDDYFEGLSRARKESRNKNLGPYIEIMANYVHGSIMESEVRANRHYIVVRHSEEEKSGLQRLGERLFRPKDAEDLDDGRPVDQGGPPRVLFNRSAGIAEGLKRVGLRAEVLRDHHVVELLRKAYGGHDFDLPRYYGEYTHDVRLSGRPELKPEKGGGAADEEEGDGGSEAGIA